jgi:hypothetical protein
VCVRIAPENVELADAAIETASFLGDDHAVYVGIVKSGSVVATVAIDADEGHDPRSFPALRGGGHRGKQE